MIDRGQASNVPAVGGMDGVAPVKPSSLVSASPMPRFAPVTSAVRIPVPHLVWHHDSGSKSRCWP